MRIKRKVVLIVGIIIQAVNCFSQEYKTDYYRYNQYGNKEKIGTSYTDMYYPQPATQFAPYQSDVPLELLMAVGMRKEAEYKYNREIIQSMVDEIMDMLSDLQSINEAAASNFGERFDRFIRNLNAAHYDLSNYNTTMAIKQQLRRYNVAIRKAIVETEK